MRVRFHRRRFLQLLGGGLTLSALAPWRIRAGGDESLHKTIPASGERLPAIGMGTWQTFNVGDDPQLRDERTRVLKTFFEYGGGMVDSSPMYGSAAAVMGYALDQLGDPDGLFSAEKVWTREGEKTREQTAEQAAAWGLERFDLMQVHNLLSWREHLAHLRAMKEAGDIRYVGITTSHGRRHRELERIMADEPVDFVQLTYNLGHREAEQRLLPLARERGIAVIANRPYAGGELIKSLKRRHRIPDWAAAGFGCRSWADFLLRFIVAHPAVTCAIPATSQVDHMRENMEAGRGPLPNARMRQRMIRHLQSL